MPALATDVDQHADDAPRVLSVSELTLLIKGVLEQTFPSVWVAGEVSNCSRPQSGHYYFTLKDDAAQIRAVVWRSTAARMRFDLEDGLEVICQGDLDLYPPRGSYQLVVRSIEPRGVGALELALRKLRERLAREGLFDPERKRPLPRFPRRVALVTSPTGAAVHDFLQVAGRRSSLVDVIVVPVRVQGQGAAEEIARAIAQVNHWSSPVDCLIVARGGGSLEDLWAFNEEITVRAIHASRVPVVSAVGHEIDVTLADLVADRRALTPSEAAELVIPSADELQSRLDNLQTRLVSIVDGRCTAARARLEAVAGRRVFRRPLEIVHLLGQRLDLVAERLAAGSRRRLTTARERSASLAARLHGLSPLAVLGRGYSLTTNEQGGLVDDALQVAPGDRLRTRLARGSMLSEVVATTPAVESTPTATLPTTQDRAASGNHS